MLMEYGRRFVISLVMALVFLGLAGCQSGSVQPRTPGTLRVLTYNIHHGEAMDKWPAPGLCASSN
jgi:hypothetical protein